MAPDPVSRKMSRVRIESIFNLKGNENIIMWTFHWSNTPSDRASVRRLTTSSVANDYHIALDSTATGSAAQSKSLATSMGANNAALATAMQTHTAAAIASDSTLVAAGRR